MMESDCCSAMVQSDQGEAVMTTEAYVWGIPEILVDDDEEAARENLQRLLESSGFATTMGVDGQGALA